MTPTSDASGGRILVVDDNEMNRDMLSRRLARRGYDVDMAEDGRIAVDMVEAGDYDLVLLDIMMPVMNGYEALEHLKANPETSHIPVIMISAVDEMESIVKCIKLGAADYLPKPFNVTILRARVEACLSIKRLHDQTQAHLQGLEREMAIGRKIQAGFLPSELPQATGWDLAAYFRPAKECAGDFYDAFWIPDGGQASGDGRIGIVVADVCDKGVGSALFMALFRSLIRATAQWHTAADTGAAPEAPAEHLLKLVHTTNDYIAQTHEAANMFSTTFVGELDPRTGTLVYVNAGHDAPVIVRASGAQERLEPTGVALGMMPDMPFGVETVTLAPGDMLVAFTDGIPDAQNASGDFFTEPRLLTLLDPAMPSAAAQREAITGPLATFTEGAEPFDDVTFLVVQRR